MHLSRIALSIVLASMIIAVVACSKQEKSSGGQQQSPPTASQPAQSGQSAATSTQQAKSAPASAGQAANVPRATEKYVLDLTNYAKVPVMVKINGQWVGQWDNHANVPLDMVVKGENQLTVELASEAKGTVTVNINTTRDGQGVTILSLNFQGQSGTHTSTFVAR